MVRTDVLPRGNMETIHAPFVVDLFRVQTRKYPVSLRKHKKGLYGHLLLHFFSQRDLILA